MKKLRRTEPLRVRIVSTSTREGKRGETNHRVHIHASHLLDQLDRRPLAVLLVKLSVGLDLLVDELAHRSLERAVVVLVVRGACRGKGMA